MAIVCYYLMWIYEYGKIMEWIELKIDNHEIEEQNLKDSKKL